ncbi:hypothetical protein A3Q56_04817 [Intoshia linei]|uniref:Uncharacterized protein n=1 Tax=Intoshia linei TaxID=1819745 RepID=A0A177AZL7_9BILA|nr:hypothetical protein A3Q56_04817 [Intoshia linei]
MFNLNGKISLNQENETRQDVLKIVGIQKYFQIINQDDSEKVCNNITDFEDIVVEKDIFQLHINLDLYRERYSRELIDNIYKNKFCKGAIKFISQSHSDPNLLARKNAYIRLCQYQKNQFARRNKSIDLKYKVFFNRKKYLFRYFEQDSNGEPI